MARAGLSQDYTLIPHSSSFNSLYLFCKECNRFWRVEMSRLAWLPLAEWPGKPPKEL